MKSGFRSICEQVPMNEPAHRREIKLVASRSAPKQHADLHPGVAFKAPSALGFKLMADCRYSQRMGAFARWLTKEPAGLPGRTPRRRAPSTPRLENLRRVTRRSWARLPERRPSRAAAKAENPRRFSTRRSTVAAGSPERKRAMALLPRLQKREVREEVVGPEIGRAHPLALPQSVVWLRLLSCF